MPSGWCDDGKRLPYNPKCEMRHRRTMRRRKRHALYKENKDVLSEKGVSRGEGMGKGDAEVT